MKVSRVWSRHSYPFSPSIIVFTAPNLSKGEPKDSSVRMAHTEKMSSLCSPLYCTMPARLSISSSMNDLTSFSIDPSSGVHSWNMDDNSPQLSSSVTIVSAVASASARAMLHPGPVVSNASITTWRYSEKSSLAKSGPELETDPETRWGKRRRIQAERDPGYEPPNVTQFPVIPC